MQQRRRGDFVFHERVGGAGGYDDLGGDREREWVRGRQGEGVGALCGQQ